MSKKSRISKPVAQLATRADAEMAVNELATAENNRRKLAAQMDAEILAIQERYQPSIALCKAAIAARTDALENWASANPQEFPKNKKSIAFLVGTIGFRTGTPKVSLLSRAWNWEKVLAAIQARAFQFVRTSEEVDKDAILSFVASCQTPEDRSATEQNVLTPIGVKVSQGETFYVEPNLTALEARPVTA